MASHRYDGGNHQADDDHRQAIGQL